MNDTRETIARLPEIKARFSVYHTRGGVLPDRISGGNADDALSVVAALEEVVGKHRALLAWAREAWGYIDESPHDDDGAAVCYSAPPEVTEGTNDDR